MKNNLTAEITKKLNDIKKCAELTGMKGKVELAYENISVREWDAAIAELKGFSRYNHMVSLADGLTVYLLLN
jgi:hypothetical protein